MKKFEKLILYLGSFRCSQLDDFNRTVSGKLTLVFFWIILISFWIFALKTQEPLTAINMVMSSIFIGLGCLMVIGYFSSLANDIFFVTLPLNEKEENYIVYCYKTPDAFELVLKNTQTGKKKIIKTPRYKRYHTEISEFLAYHGKTDDDEIDHVECIGTRVRHVKLGRYLRDGLYLDTDTPVTTEGKLKLNLLTEEGIKQIECDEFFYKDIYFPSAAPEEKSLNGFYLLTRNEQLYRTYRVNLVDLNVEKVTFPSVIFREGLKTTILHESSSGYDVFQRFNDSKRKVDDTFIEFDDLSHPFAHIWKYSAAEKQVHLEFYGRILFLDFDTGEYTGIPLRSSENTD